MLLTVSLALVIRIAAMNLSARKRANVNSLLSKNEGSDGKTLFPTLIR